MPAPVPNLGQLVNVRQRRYVVDEVTPSALPAPLGAGLDKARPQHLVQLSSVEDDGLGEQLQVIWELEPGAQVYERDTLPEMSGFDAPARLDAFLHAVRWGATSSADHQALHAPFRSGISIEDFQLDPVVRALRMPRVNLLIADDVGLGKTIEAGLVVQELLLRHRARSVLVVCPAGLQLQWQDQMRDKFGLEFRIVDSALRKRLRRSRGLHVNPWSHFPRLITSIDFLKREQPLRLMRELLPAPNEPAFPRRFDLLIVDEAHNVAPSGRGRYAIDSQRTHAVRALARHFEHKLFLTATPHNGYAESFSALLELLDDQRFHRGVMPAKTQLGAVMVRRLKREVTNWDGTPRYPPRELVPLDVEWTEAEKAAHAALRAYTQRRMSGAEDATEKFATEFVLKLLKKRLFSSPQAFADTLAKHEQSLREVRRAKRKGARKLGGSLRVLERRVEEVDEDFGDDEAWEEATQDTHQDAVRLFRDLDAEERRLLKKLRDWAAAASGRPDAKAARLLSWLEAIVRPNGVWSEQRVILFTEYRATQKWLQTLMATRGLTEEGRLMTLYGGMDREEREVVKAAFQADPKDAPVRILLATDAASEGIDLQNHCYRLVHYEIPWNPNRMEQRNGRVDRHGQRAEKVLVHHFVSAGYQHQGLFPKSPGDLEGDLEFLFRAAQKVETIREDLGKVGPVIAHQVNEAMLGRKQYLDTKSAEAAASEARELLKLERKFRDEIAKLHEQMDDSRRELDLSPESVQAVVEVGLELAAQPPLTPVTEGELAGRAFHLPALRGSWARCSEGLAHPHTGRVRPITFSHDAAAGRDDVVLAHLNHRLVRMCLHLLRAEVWNPDDASGLHRVTARVVPGHALAEPVLVAHARLVVLGGDNERLHEELLMAGGRLRKGLFARLLQRDLQQALDAATADVPGEGTLRRLQELWPRVGDRVLAALEARQVERTESLTRLLTERCEDEVERVRRVLLGLQADIERRLEEQAQKPDLQMSLFSPEEGDQYRQNHEALQARLKTIPAEIEREVAAIRARYAEPSARLFPVAVTALLPANLR